MILPSYQLLVEPRGKAFDLFWIWVGGRAVLASRNPYGPETTQVIQLGVFGRVIPPDEYQHGFPHPAHIALVLLPFIVLPFSWSVLLWVSWQIPLFMANLVLSFKVFNWPIHPSLVFLLALLTTLGFRYPINVYVLGQLTIFLTFCVLLSTWLFQQHHPRWAAVALACATIRPDLSLLAIPLAFLLIRNSPKRNEFVATLVGAGVILGLLPIFFIGFWPLTWLKAIKAYGSNPFVTWPPELLPSPWLVAALLAGVTAWMGRYVVLAWWKPTPFYRSLMVSATVLFGLIVMPQTGSYSLTFALISALILWRYARPLGLQVMIAGSLLMPWFYFMLGKPFDTWIFLLIPCQFILLQEITRLFHRSS